MSTNFTEVLKAMRSNEFAQFLLVVLFSIIPGIAVIYWFRPDLFVNLDWIKLSLFAMTVTAPLILVNTLVAFAADTRPNDRELGMFRTFAFGTLVSGMVVYIMLGIAYAFDLMFSTSIIGTIAIEVIIGVAMFRLAALDRKKAAARID